VYLSSFLFLGKTGLVFSLWLVGGVGGDVVRLLGMMVDDVLFVVMVKFGSFRSAGRETKKKVKA